MSLQDLVKFITQQAVIQMDKPTTIRKEERKRRKSDKGTLSFRAFGVVPMAIGWFFKRNKQ
ncbi:YqzE family protein [Alkalicoccobacillus plakortidis]|uniref:YqzE family protein n=1 Tax=Alkalicoccobacillus plakortidis TaxID=444060 RepID=A0ABT0XGJ1_9BACI|nr:YqzE family protein [Alkalicoccobacillus plakortidis]MCM2675011.1 YqzE family protein [Alkalicoccobacillus plakortidis]